MTDDFKYFRVDYVDDVAIIRPTKPDFLSQVANVEMKKELVDYARRTEPMKVLVNFENIRRFSTEFIGNLLSMKKLLGAEAAVKLCSMEPLHREVFDMLKLTDTVFEIYDSPDDGLASFRE